MSKHPQYKPLNPNLNTHNAGLYIQERDQYLLTTIGKWWCITPDHLLRTLLTNQQTQQHYTHNTTTPEQKETLRKTRRNLRERLEKLQKTDPPLVTTGYLPGKKITYWLTPAGGETIGAPFTKYPHGNTQRAPHAWAAADIGIRLQQEGYTVYSERETATGETTDRTTEIWEPGNPINPTPGSKATNPHHHTMRPDLTIPTTDGRFIFIEIERKISGVRSYYERKINSYLANPKIAAIWYITDKPVVAKRLNTVHQRIKNNHPPKPFRILPMTTHPNGYTQFTGWDKHTQELTQTLTELKAQTKDNTHE